ncbi:hypothetical protein, partial [Actinomadura sp. 6K520]|uniref:hypothetical protein n=1 Tax=Actinomadura sp. 6K520 TaxID=2530364 RepID=UPI001046DE5D
MMAQENTTALAGAEMAHGGRTTPEDIASGTGTDRRNDGPAAAVVAALTADPGSTVAAIARAAGVSKNTARKALLELETQELAVRTAGGRTGGKRAADTWHPAPIAHEEHQQDDPPVTPEADHPEADTAPVDTAPADGGAEAGEQEAPASQPDEAASTVDAEPDSADQEESTDEESAEEEGMEAAAVEEANEALTELRQAMEAVTAALAAGDRDAARTSVEAVYTGSGKARRLVRAAAGGRRRTVSGRARSQPGELRRKVADHLTGYPGSEFTPHEIGKVIGHSAGAVANALDRLVNDGEAEQTCERPRRFIATHPATQPGSQAPVPDEP